MLTSESTTAELGPKEIILGMLEESNCPLSLKQIRENWDGHKPSEVKTRRLLKDMLLEGQIFECSPSKGSKRFWLKDEEQMARDAILKIVGSAPKTKKQLDEQLKNELPKGNSECWRMTIVKKMREEGQLYIFPKTHGSGNHIADKPIKPTDYFTKTIAKQFKTIYNRFLGAGFSYDQFLEVLAAQLKSKNSGNGDNSKSVNGIGEDHGAPTIHNDNQWQKQEVIDLIFKGMVDIDARAAQGAKVSTIELRNHMPPEYQTREFFDKSILDLADQNRVYIYIDNEPNLFPENERNRMVQDDQGNYFIYIAERV